MADIPIGRLLTLVCWLCFASVACGQAAYLTITNPNPTMNDRFGDSVAPVGTDRILIGAPRTTVGATNTGVAYLFDTSGVLLTTFTNPIPGMNDRFGFAVTGVGHDKVLIGAFGDATGAYNTGAAYLFSTNGALLTIFTNPTPAAADLFAYAVAGVGSDTLVIGAYDDDTGTRTDNGIAYLFSVNGTLLTTLTNPTPQTGDHFGYSVAGVGPDKVLIGAYGDNTGATDTGAAYLFSTNGTLLTTFTNPTPISGEAFGNALTAVGSDKVLIAAYYAQSEGPPYNGLSVGAAYLFNTNGNLLKVFANPTPADLEFFGISVAAVDSDKVLIGAERDNAGGAYTGAAYLYNINGSLLMAITNPAPVYFDYFGDSVAAVGSDKILIGARYVDTGAADAGVAYLFSVAPTLAVSITTTNTIRVSWASGWTGWLLQQNDDLTSTNWVSPSETATNNGAINYIIVNPPVGNRFYRLFKP